MASIDPEKGQVVVRLVYDGPAWAGKTTTLRALAKSLGREAYSGDEEDGRTLHFDWLDYVGGLFEGMPIRCQVVGVPGQRVLERRRRRLLATADVVVFIADSRPERLEETVGSFGVLQEVTAQADGPIGIVVQANKRDVPGAVSLDLLRERLGDAANLAMTEAVASHGDGVRETFVLAVRLALDRVRAEWQAGSLARAVPVVDSGAQLLEAVMAAEDDATSPAAMAAANGKRSAPRLAAGGAVRGEGATAVTEQGDVRAQGPMPPDASVGPGLVWPPVSGRVAVHEAARSGIRLQRRADGDWLGEAITGDWRLASPLDALYFDLEEGRQALIGWARWHTLAGPRLSPERAIVLAVAAPGAWRLWQIVRRRNTLLDLCRVLVSQRDRAVGEGLFRILDLRLRAERDLVSAGWLPAVDLDTITASATGEPLYAGFVPFPAPQHRQQRVEGVAGENEWIGTELAATLRNELALTPGRLPAVLAGVDQAAAVKDRPQIAQLVRRLLLAS